MKYLPWAVGLLFLVVVGLAAYILWTRNDTSDDVKKKKAKDAGDYLESAFGSLGAAAAQAIRDALNKGGG